MSEGIKNSVSNICNTIGILILVYSLFYNFFVKNITIQETILTHLIDYVIAFLPIIVGILFHIGRIIDEGFHGPETTKYLLKPIIFFITAGINFLVIQRFNMLIGLQFQINNMFLEGMLILMVIAVMEAGIFAYLENDSIHAVFAGSTFWVSWLTLAVVNGGVEANRRISLYGVSSSVSEWIKYAFLYTILFAIVLFFHLILAIIKFILCMK